MKPIGVTKYINFISRKRDFIHCVMIPWVVFMVVDCVLEVLRENRGSAIVDVNQ